MSDESGCPCPTHDASVEWGSFGQQIVLFHPISKQYFILNSMARRIWELCDGATTVERIATRIAAEQHGPARGLDTDVRETISGLCELGVLIIGLEEAPA